MEELLAEIKADVTSIIARYKRMAADGKVTIAEILTFASNAVATFVQLVEKLDKYTGTDKKAAVLKSLEQLIDTVIVPMDIASIPNFLEPLVDAGLKSLIMSLAGSWIDSLVNIFNKSGWNAGGLSAAANSDLLIYGV